MKKLCFFITTVLFSAALICCAQNSAQPVGGVEITVVTSFGGEDGNRGNYWAACKDYEAATGNTVNDRSATANEEWKAKVLSDFNSGSEPDVCFFFAGTDADILVNNDMVVPISDIRNDYPSYASNMKDSMMPVSTADGRQYAVPVNGYWEGLYVNKKVLADCGVEIPGEGYSWERFIEDCRVIRDRGYIPIACSLNEVPHYWFEFCTFNNGSIYNHTALPKSADDELGKIWSAGLSDLKALYDYGFFPEDTNTITDSEADLLMTSNRAAFKLDGSWKLGWLQSNAENVSDFAVTYVPAKGERQPTEIIGGLSMGYYITRKAWNDPKKRDACVQFVMQMTADEVVSNFGALSVTALKNGTAQPKNADALVVSSLAMTRGCTGIVPAVQDGLSPTARTALFNDIKKIVTGAVTPAQAIDNALRQDTEF